MASKTLAFDAAKHLALPKAQAELLSDAYASGNDAYIDMALATVVRARKSALKSENPSPAQTQAIFRS